MAGIITQKKKGKAKERPNDLQSARTKEERDSPSRSRKISHPQP